MDGPRPLAQQPDPAPAGVDEKVQLFAAGLNAHGQLSAGHNGQDIPSFLAITAPAPCSSVNLLHASWSTTTLRVDAQILELGGPRGTHAQTIPAEANKLFDAFGDHNGMTGCIDSQGRLYARAIEDLLCLADKDGSPLIGHIAMAGNGEVAITFKQAPNGRLCHVLCFDDQDQLQDWYNDPAGVKYDAERQHFMMQGQPRQLIAGTGTFLLRMESGEVYSWGDARYSSLGRSISDVPAERPGPVEALGGLKIRKVACGGWLNAALSEDGACYLWGAQTPGTEQTIRCLRDAGSGEVVLTELPIEEGEEPLDMIDVAIGDNHIVLLAQGGRCFVAGANKNGQLGLNHFEPFVEDWTEVPLDGSKIRSIACGPKSTYVFAASSG